MPHHFSFGVSLLAPYLLPSIFRTHVFVYIPRCYSGLAIRQSAIFAQAISPTFGSASFRLSIHLFGLSFYDIYFGCHVPSCILYWGRSILNTTGTLPISMSQPSQLADRSPIPILSILRSYLTDDFSFWPLPFFFFHFYFFRNKQALFHYFWFATCS